jgi:hypothetical protein
MYEKKHSEAHYFIQLIHAKNRAYGNMSVSYQIENINKEIGITFLNN